MIKFFRKIRYDLLEKSKVGKYLLYSIGEIFLVVIGILIALSLNNWNENRKNILAEKRYIDDLIKDLKNDAVMLKDISIFLESKSRSKAKIEPILKGKNITLDSMEYHFNSQWSLRNRFAPTTITIEELKNSGNLNIIRDTELRRAIVSLYNNYNIEEFSEDMFNQQNVKLLGVASKYFDNLLEPKTEELMVALEDKVFKNAIITNFTFARKEAINDLQIQCAQLIKKLEAYQVEIIARG